MTRTSKNRFCARSFSKRTLQTCGLALPLSLAACGSDETRMTEDTGAAASFGVLSFALSSELPKCSKSNQGRVYYVRKEAQFYFCDKGRQREVELAGDPAWLVAPGKLPAGACPDGGAVLHMGPDTDEDGRLDHWERASTATLCSGRDGAEGADGQDGSHGLDGSDGRDGVDGQSGSDGPAGAAGRSCTVTSNGDETASIHCSDGTSAIVRGGSDGVAGQNGSDGADGADGSSCTVRDNGDGSKSISCTDGRLVIVRDGQDGGAGQPCSVLDNHDGSKTISCPGHASVTVTDGADAAAHESLLRILNEPLGVNCSAGGHRVELGLDVNADGVLASGEVTSTAYACAEPIVIPGTIYVSHAGDLAALRGVGRMGGLTIGGTVSDLSDLRSLTRVDGNLSISDTLLTNLQGLEQLASVGGFITVQSNSALVDIDGLSQLTSANGLNVRDNPVLENLDGLAGLSQLNHLNLRGNLSLANVGGVAHLSSLVSVSVENLAAGTDLTGLQGMSVGTLGLTNNPSLTNLDDFAQLSINGIYLVDNPVLSDLEGLSHLTQLTGYLSIMGNPALIHLSGLRNLTSVGNLTIERTALTGLEDLNALTTVTGSLHIQRNDALTSVGLRRVSSVQAWAIIHHNPVLAHMDGLDSLVSVATTFSIYGNDTLMNLRSLAALDRVGEFYVFENPQLATCEAVWLRNRVASITGTISIHSNTGIGSCP